MRCRGEKRVLSLPQGSSICCFQTAPLPFSPCLSLIHPSKIQLGNPSAKGLPSISWELGYLFPPPLCSLTTSTSLWQAEFLGMAPKLPGPKPQNLWLWDTLPWLCYVIKRSWAFKRVTNNVSPIESQELLKVQYFLRLVVKEEGGERWQKRKADRVGARKGLHPPLLVWRRRKGPHGKECSRPLGTVRGPWLDNQQGNKDLGPTASKNWILPPIRMSLKVDSSPKCPKKA